MTEFVKPRSASYSKIKENLIETLKSYPDDKRFNDFYNLSSSTILVELLAGLGSYFQFTAASNRRETYLHYAEVRNSAIALAAGKNYSVFQGRNDTFLGDLTITESGVLQPYYKIGNYGSEFVTYLGFKDPESGEIRRESLPVNEGEVHTIYFTVGELKTETITSNRELMYRFSVDDMTEEYFFTVNNKIMDFSRIFRDVVHGNLISISNTLGGVDVFNWERLSGIIINPGEELKWHYISRVYYKNYDLTKFGFVMGRVENVEIFEANQFEESLEEIQVNAPIAQETTQLIRARKDELKLLRQQISQSIDVAMRNAAPGLVELSYILNDESLLHPVDKENLVKEREENRVFGIPPSKIVDPIKREVGCTVTLSLVDVRNVDVNALKLEVEELTRGFLEMKLGLELDFKKLEYQLERLDHIETARIVLTDDSELSWNEYLTTMVLLIEFE